MQHTVSICVLIVCLYYTSIVFANEVADQDQFLKCSVSKPPENGYISNSVLGILETKDFDADLTISNFDFVEIECFDGYERVGPKKIYCHDGNLLTGPVLPNCIKKSCGNPPEIENGYYDDEKLQGRYPMKTYLLVRCQPGFRRYMKGPKGVWCRRNGTNLVWQKRLPVCEPIPSCGDPGTPLNGHRSDDSFFSGDSVSFKCDPEFELLGPNIITCSYEGVWSSPRPRCKPKSTCPDPPAREHVIYESPNATADFFILNDEVKIHCEEGYYIPGETDNLFCVNSAPVVEDDYGADEIFPNEEKENIELFWHADFPDCIEIICEKPKVPIHGHIRQLREEENSQLEEFPYDYNINYGCNEGYQLIGPHTRTCEETGWSPSTTPQCQKIMCTIPNTPDEGWKIVKLGSASGRNVGDVFEFGCFSGYELLGSSKRICLENGQWSGEPAVCTNEETHCPNPGTPLHGSKSGMDYYEGAIVRFSCDNEFVIIGSAVRECLKNRTWSGEPVTCKKYTDFDRTNELKYRLFGTLDSMTLAKDSINQILRPPASLEIRSLPSEIDDSRGRILKLDHKGGNILLYFIFDSSESVGERNFNLSIDFVKAIVKRIGVSRNGVRVGAAAFGSTVNKKHSFLPIDNDNTDDVLHNLESLKKAYTGGGTNINEALQYININHFDVVKANPNINKPVKTHVFLLSDGIYNDGGNPTALALNLKKQGVEFSCVAITGDKLNIQLLHEVASMPSNVYEMKDYEQISWMVDEVLTEQINYSRCGLAVNEAVNNGRAFGNITKTYWPWMAMLMEKKEDSLYGFCGGSIIDGQWILTAAHCLFDPTHAKKYQEKDIVVRLGYTKNNVLSFKVDIATSALFVHPKYFKDARFNFDVALIKLERAITYSQYVRPICLSPRDKDIPEKSVLYKANSEAWAIGYGTFQKGKINEKQRFRDLREVALDVQPEETCRKGVEKTEYRYTEAMICAGGLEGRDTCDGDSGGPFMKHQYNNDGEGYWIQTGIVSFNPKNVCGKKDEYGYYTRVSMVREWIDDIIKKN